MGEILSAQMWNKQRGSSLYFKVNSLLHLVFTQLQDQPSLCMFSVIAH